MSSSDRTRGPRPVPPPGGTGADARANPYARFIPREELERFDAWAPGAFGDGAAAPRAPAVEPPPPPPKTTDEVRAEIEAQMKAVRQAGYQDGYRDGLAALEAFKTTYARQVSTQVDAVVGQWHGQLDTLEQAMAEEVTAIAVRLARQVLRHELATHPEQVAQVAQEAVNAVVLSARHLRLKVHPDDLALVEAGAAEPLAARQVRLMADAAVGRGGCVVESDLGRVDAQIESRWAQALDVLGRDEPLNPPEAAA